MTRPSSAFGTFSPLTRGEGHSIARRASVQSTSLDARARVHLIIHRESFARVSGEKVPKADEVPPPGFLERLRGSE